MDRPGHERFLVFAACLTLLGELAEGRPVLCLIDDAHWLDAASADALRFVARRLDAEGIVMLVAVREEEVNPFEGAGLPSLVVGGLDDEAAATLLGRGAGVDAAPSVRARLVEHTRGNPLALLELPTGLSGAQLAGDAPLPDALPTPRQVEGVFLDRVRRLPDDVQRFLLLAAADDTERASLVTRAGRRLGIDPEALGIAEQMGLVNMRGPRLEFRHPLVRSAIYDAATSTERRAAHLALAQAIGTDEEHADRRAWHLASSTIDPDESVVAALEDAARRAEARGGHAASTRAFERAAELAAGPSEEGRLLVASANAASVAGLYERSTVLARRALPLVEGPLPRGEIAKVLAIAEIQRGRPATVVQSLMGAAEEIAPLDPAKATELVAYGLHAGSEAGDLAAHRQAADLAATLVRPGGDERLRAVAQMLAGCASIVEGDLGRGLPLLDEALVWVAAGDDLQTMYWGSAMALWTGDEHRALALADRVAGVARERGAIGVLTGAQAVRASQLFLAQRFHEASVAAGETLRLATDVGSENYELLALGVLGALAAIRGDDEAARRHGAAVIERGGPRGLAVRLASARRTLALLALGRGRWAEALEHYDAFSAGPRDQPIPLVALMCIPDRLEAAVRAGRDDLAAELLATFGEWVASSGAPWARPRLEGCRGIVADGDAATEHFEAALAVIGEARPFDRSRIHLLYGEHLRRQRRRTLARAQLTTALEGFESIGAEPWAARARNELRATGSTARKRDPSMADQLTMQEVQIARYVADGLSNKEIAAQMFLSPRTIDSHLRNIFAKLGITSRVQLARLPLGEDAASGVTMDAAPL